jgi:hypothetical protein
VTTRERTGRPQLLFAGWSSRAVLLALAVSAVVMVLGAAQKAPCAEHERYQKVFATRVCYTDISQLYAGRGLNLPFGWFGGENPAVSEIEYPPLTVIFMEATARVTHVLDGDTPQELAARARHAGQPIPKRPPWAPPSGTFYWVNAVALAVLGTLSLWLLAGLVEPRIALRFVPIIAPLILFEGFINWDLIAMFLVTVALVAWRARSPAVAGVALGLGTAAKLYPVLLLGPLVVLALRRRQLSPAVTAVASAAITWVVVNAPFFLIHRESWLTFWRFNSTRNVSLGSIWYALGLAGIHVPVHVANAVYVVLLLVAFAGVLWLGLRAPREPSYAALSLLVVTAFIVTNKVISPQYVLWVIPMIVLTSRRWRLLAAWAAVEVVYYLFIWQYLAYRHDTWLHPVYAVLIVVRIAMEVAVAVAVLRDLMAAEADSGDDGPGQALPNLRSRSA